MKIPLCTGVVLLSVCLTHLHAAALYVDLNSPNPTPPYADWSTAATTIQDAVDASSAGDTIWVTNGLYQTGGRPAPGETLTNRVVVTNAISLQSVNGPEVTLIAGYQVPTNTVGDAAVRCVHLADGCTLNGFTLTNGATRTPVPPPVTDQGHGGGAWCQSTNVTLTNCIVVSNSCAFYGGGVYSGTLKNCQVHYNSTCSGSYGGGGGVAYSVVCDSLVRSNTAFGGPPTAPGGLLNCVASNSIIQGNWQAGACYCQLYNCSITDNSSTSSGGGAIQSLLNNCTVSGNYASQHAGGLYNCTLYNTIVSSNRSGSWGGGLYYDQSTNSVGRSNLVCGNTTPYQGGGVYLAGNHSLQLMDFVNWTVVSNSAAQDGGGLYAYFASPIQLDGSVFAGNYAGGNGGGFCAYASGPPLSNCTFTGNIAVRAGGGACNAALVNCLVLNNQAANGGGLSGVATNSVFVANAATNTGGGLSASVSSPPAFVLGCSFTNNSAVNGGGASGGILANCTFYGNSALANGGAAYSACLSNSLVVSNQAAFGGGLYDPSSGGVAYPGTSFNCLNSTIAGNSARTDGGGLYFPAPYLGTNCLISYNTAGNNGGGLVAGNFSRSTIVGNSAGASGGGAYNATLSTSGVSNNTAKASGGGVYGGNLSLSIVANNMAGTNGGGACNSSLDTCLVTGNTAASGGGVYATTLNNATLVKNEASVSGGGTYFPSGGSITGCIIYDNTAPSGPNNGGYAAYNYCCTTPAPSVGSANLTSDPAFIDLAGGNYRLQTNSPCINMGNGGGVDLDGRPRPVGGRSDMGAYEFRGAGMGEFIAWLQQHGLPFNGSADYIDTDNDGLNNWQEWLAGTDPTNTVSVLKLLTPTVAADGSGTLVSWQSVTNRNYFLQRSDDLLAPGAFSSIQSNIAGQVSTTSYLDTNAPVTGSVFYRVGVQ